MAKIVGLSRNLKLQWLNKVVELASSNLTEQEIKDQLNEYLSFEISSPTNLRKTREILMNIWVYENDISNKLKRLKRKQAEKNTSAPDSIPQKKSRPEAQSKREREE